jgi:pyruvate carboxylase
MSDIQAINKMQPTKAAESAIEDGVDTHTQNTVHARLRANSSVMKAKKILGKPCLLPCQS